MRYRRVEMMDGSVRYIPVPEDPIKSLSDSASEELEDASIEEMRAVARLEARRQADAARYRGERWSKDEDGDR
jgi:hypothetical protein